MKEILNQLWQLFKTNPIARKHMIDGANFVAKHVDAWLTTEKIEVAKKRIDKLVKKGNEFLLKYYNEHKDEMSPIVKKEFKKRL